MSFTNLENTLLYTPGSLFSSVGILLLHETKNKDKYALKEVDLVTKGENNSPEFIKLNKHGLVPVLIHGTAQEQVIPDSLAIAKFLDADGHLKSQDAQVVDQVESWRQFGFRFLTLAEAVESNPNYTSADLEVSLQETQQRLQKYAKEHPDVDYQERIAAFDTKAKLFLDHDYLKQHKKQWLDHLDKVNQLLAHQTHLVGDDYTLADLYASVYLFAAQRRLYTNVFENRPYLEKYYQRQLKRPSFIQTFFKY